MSRHRIGSLCSGYGGLDMAVAAYFKHGTRTGLWHHVVQAIDGLRPEWVVLENVPGLFTADGDEWPDHLHALHDEWQRWVRIERLIDAKLAKATRKGRDNGEWHTRKRVERVRAVRRRKRAVARFRAERYRSVPRAIATVLGSLAALGYDAQWHCISAAEVGACHKRERVFILARDEAGRAAADASGDGRAEGQGEQVADDDGSGGERAGESVGTDRRPVQRVAPDLLLPTPMVHPSGNSPENHLRKKPGRKRRCCPMAGSPTPRSTYRRLTASRRSVTACALFRRTPRSIGSCPSHWPHNPTREEHTRWPRNCSGSPSSQSSPA